MNIKLHRNILLTALVAGIFLSLEVRAEVSVKQEIKAGFQIKDVNSPEAKFEEYGEVPDGIFIERYELDAEDETTDLNVELKNIRQNNQSAEVEYNKGKLNVEASWDQTPHLISKDSRTPFQETSDGNLSVPDTLRDNMQNSGGAYTIYEEAMHPVELKKQTDRGSIDLNYALGEGYNATVGFSETIKKGHQALGASFTRSHIVNIAQPIDEKTYQSNVGFGFSSKDFQWNLGYGLSAYRNDRETLIWENPRRMSDSDSESSRGRLNAAPDNMAHFTSLNGGISLPAKTRFTADVNMSYMRQNQSLLAFSINTANTPFTNTTDPSLLPTDKANAKVVNWDQDYKLTNKAFDLVSMGLRYHSFQQNNDTPEYTFTGSAGLDFNDSTTDTTNHAFEMRKDSLKGNLDFHLTKSLDFGTSYEMAWINREHREVEDVKEGTLELGVDYKPSRVVLVRGSIANARRRMDNFHVAEQIGAGETPGMRHYDVSDRDRNDGKLLVQLVTEKTNLGIRGSLGHDKYKPGKGDLAALNEGGDAANLSTMYGLLESRRAGAGIDFDQTCTEKYSFFSFYDYYIDKGNQRSNYNPSATHDQDAATDWEHEVTNRYQTFGLGVNADVGITILTIGVDLTQSKGNYNYVARGSDPAVQVDNYPETKTTLQDYYVKAKVPVSKGLAFGLGYLFEKYDVYDWASDLAPAVNRTAELYLADASQDYKAHIVTASVEYKFGN